MTRGVAFPLPLSLSRVREARRDLPAGLKIRSQVGTRFDPVSIVVSRIRSFERVSEIRR